MRIKSTGTSTFCKASTIASPSSSMLSITTALFITSSIFIATLHKNTHYALGNDKATIALSIPLSTIFDGSSISQLDRMSI